MSVRTNARYAIPFLTLVAAALVLIGAGCGQGQIAIPPEQANGESALSLTPRNPAESQPAEVQQQPPAAANANAMPATTNPDQTAPAAAPSAAPAPAVQKPPAPTSFPGVLPAKEMANKQAHIVTDKGDIIFDILGTAGPKAASNFIALARSGFYDGLLFHRVVPTFVIQGGDPLTRDPGKSDLWGTGGPGYSFADDKVTLDYKAGIVAMANSGPDTNGSQFFIVLDDQPTLDKKYSIFGRVTAGLDVARQIVQNDVIRSITIEDKK